MVFAAIDSANQESFGGGEKGLCPASSQDLFS